MPSLSTDDRLQLHELAARYGNTLDARDWDRFATCFTADCYYELAGFGRLDQVIVGVQALREYMEHSAGHPTAHHVTNVEIDGTGDDVRMFSKIVGTLPQGLAGSADYNDIVMRTADSWRIARRIVTLRRS